MLLDPYACFVTAPCLAAALLVSIPIAWVWRAYTSRMQRLRAREERRCQALRAQCGGHVT